MPCLILQQRTFGEGQVFLVTRPCSFAANLINRGGVEDTRIEAKDTKKIRGQEQPFRGQTLSRPRTGMLEAKAKDQGHKRKCSPKKKKVFTKTFQAISKKKKKKKVFTKIFQAISTKNVFQKLFQALHKILTIQKLCCPRAEDRPIFEDLRPRGRGQGLQNVSSRTPPLLINNPLVTSSMHSKRQSQIKTCVFNFRLRKATCFFSIGIMTSDAGGQKNYYGWDLTPCWYLH